MKLLIMAILFAVLALMPGCFAMPVEEPSDVLSFFTQQATYMYDCY